MNEKMVLEWLLEDTHKKASGWYRRWNPRRQKLEVILADLHDKEDWPPLSLPGQEMDMLQALREQCKNNVTHISLVLNRHFPDRYVFYRVSDLEEEIFAGFDFLKPAAPEFDFPFSPGGPHGRQALSAAQCGAVEVRQLSWFSGE